MLVTVILYGALPPKGEKMTKKYQSLLSWQPTIKYKTKLIHIDNIVFDETRSQVRQGSVDNEKVKELEGSITAIGMLEPIDVEEDEFKPQDPDATTYLGRDGKHRYTAKTNLHQRYGKGHELIPCRVSEKNNSSDAELQWKTWQISKNVHADKTHLSNSLEDYANHLSVLLRAGKLNKTATTAFRNSRWDTSDIEEGLREYIGADDSFKTLSHAKRDKLIDMVYENNGAMYHHKIKRYTASEKRKILSKKFNTLKVGQLSQCGKRIVKFATSDDYHAQILGLLRPMLEEGSDPNTENIIVFHSKKKDTNVIDKERAKAFEMTRKLNKWFQKVTGSPNAKVAHRFYCLGQKLDPAFGEKEDQLINKRL